jgi:hypothetical protein
MVRLMIALIPLVAAPAAATASPERSGVSERCQEIRLLRDGRELRREISVTAGRSGDNWAMSRSSPSGGWSSARSRSRSGAGASSVSSSSSVSTSSSGGRGTSRAVSSYSDEDGRTVTTTHDDRGCTIVIDERETKGE